MGRQGMSRRWWLLAAAGMAGACAMGPATPASPTIAPIFVPPTSLPAGATLVPPSGPPASPPAAMPTPAMATPSPTAAPTGPVAATPTAPIAQPAVADAAAFIERALAMQRLADARGDQPFGAVVVRDGRIVGEAPSRVVTNEDPTAHAEMEAIRDAARRLGTRDLSGGVLYGSARACPMCESAAYWARISRLVYGPDGRDGGPPRLGG